MKNILKILLITFILFVCASVSNANANKKAYINGVDIYYPPYSYLDENGYPDGFDVASMNWIAKEMNLKILHQPMHWGAFIPALLAKEIDMASGGISILPIRQKLVTFSKPYWQSQIVYLAKSDSALDANTIQTTKIRLGAQRNTSSATIAQKNIYNKGYAYALRFYHSTSLPIEDLIIGRIGAVALDSGAAENAIAKGKPVKIVGQLGTTNNFGIAMRHEDKELHAIINEGYKRLMADPYWKELQKTYFKKE